MKTVLLAFTAFLVQVNSALATGFSGTNNGVYIAISGLSTNERVMYGEPLAWRPFCSSADGQSEFNYPGRDYFINMTMLDALGKKVPKTEMGMAFGVKFDQLHSYQDIVGSTRAGYSNPHIGSILAQGPYDVSAPVSGPLLPAPKELFQIEAPGNYALQIQMQMFLIHKNADQWTRDLIRFSPVTIMVEKPPGAK
jgi:hypothetical protein